MTSESGSSPSKNSPIGTLNAFAKRESAAILMETLHRSTLERKLLLMPALVATCSSVSRRLSRSSRICFAMSCSGISITPHAGLPHLQCSMALSPRFLYPLRGSVKSFQHATSVPTTGQTSQRSVAHLVGMGLEVEAEHMGYFNTDYLRWRRIRAGRP